jgi:uncharacterized repeat protein (TIGR01451 family)
VSNGLPWRRPRREPLLLALVAAVALSPVFTLTAQDHSRLCLTRAIVHGRLHDDVCLSNSFDRSRYGGHLYSDKAPGLSLLELPAAEALLDGPVQDGPAYSLRLWGVRVLASGIAFLACAFVLGRIAEGLRTGYGAASLVTFALGTLMAPLAAANFSHVIVAALGFGAFALAWSRRGLLAGVLAGTAVLCDYQAALLLALVGVYVAARGLRPVARYAAGCVPGIALLGVYDQLAFGAPWHASYRYIDNLFSTSQAGGFFGIGTPHLYSAFMVFAGNGGLLVVSPVLAAAVWGLVLLGRERPHEALLCAAVAVAYVLVNAGYFLPYGGVSPGPRFLVPALPFLAVGLAPAFAWRPRVTAALAVLSVIPSIALTLVWPTNNPLRHTVWGQLAQIPSRGGSSKFVHSLMPTVLHWLGVGRVWGAVAVALVAAAALAVAFQATPFPRVRWSRAAVAAVGATVYAIAAAATCAIAAYPYGQRTLGVALYVDLRTSIQASSALVRAGDPVSFVVTAWNPGELNVTSVVLTIRLDHGMQLLGPPAFERGPGCKGTSTLSCNLSFLEGGMSTTIRFGVRITEPHDQTVRTLITSEHVAALNNASYTVRVE